MAENNSTEAIDQLNAQLQQINSDMQSQRNYEDQKAFQKDVMRSQMMYQHSAYQQAFVDNSIAGLARQYSEAGFNPRDALARNGNSNPMSAPSGMSAPSAPVRDLSPIIADMQLRHDSRMDDVQRALSASKLMTDDKQRHVLENQAYGILQSVLKDQHSMKLADAQFTARVLEFYENLSHRQAELRQRKDIAEKQLAETHRHNKATELTDLEFMLDSGDAILEQLEDWLEPEEGGFIDGTLQSFRNFNRRQRKAHRFSQD